MLYLKLLEDKMHKVLIIDDYEGILKSLQAMMTDAGYEAHIAQDHFQAGQLCRRNSYSLIISDNQMGMETRHWGINLIPRLKKWQPEAKTILMSADDITEHPADYFIAKSHLATDLIPLVRSLL